MARALYGQPRLLILDDPLSAVDVKSQAKLLQTLHEFVEGDTGPANADKAGGKRRPRNGAIVALNELHHLSHFTRILGLEGGSLTEKSADEFAEAKAAAPQPAMAPAPAKEEVPSSNGKHDAKEVEITIVHSEKPNAKTEKSGTKEAAAPEAALVVAETSKTGGFGGTLLLSYYSKFGLITLLFYFVMTIAMNSSIVLGDVLLSAWSCFLH